MITGYARVGLDGDGATLRRQEAQLVRRGADRIVGEQASLGGASKLEAAIKNLSKGDELAIVRLGVAVSSATDLVELLSRLRRRGARLHVMAIGRDFDPEPHAVIDLLLDDLKRAEVGAKRELELCAVAGSRTGRPASARGKAAQVLDLKAKGHAAQQIADRLKIGVASVYRILKDAR